DALQTATATAHTAHHGVTFPMPLSAGLTVSIIVNASAPGILDGWFDLNQDGVWDSTEKLISGQQLNAGNNTVTFKYGTSTAPHGTTFARFRFSSAGINSPIGLQPDGEVEDYKITTAGPPFQNPINNLDVNNDGHVTSIDVLLVINFFNFYSRQVKGNIPLPFTSPPFPAPAPVIDPTGGGVPGNGRYLDVNGDGSMSSIDALLLINAINTPGAAGEGEGESGV